MLIYKDSPPLSDRNFLYSWVFFRVILSSWVMVDFVFYCGEQYDGTWWKTITGLSRYMSLLLMLTRESRVPDPKASGSKRTASVGGGGSGTLVFHRFIFSLNFCTCKFPECITEGNIQNQLYLKNSELHKKKRLFVRKIMLRSIWIFPTNNTTSE